MVLRSSKNTNSWPGVKMKLNKCGSIVQLSCCANNENLFSEFIFGNCAHNSYFVHTQRDLLEISCHPQTNATFQRNFKQDT